MEKEKRFPIHSGGDALYPGRRTDPRFLLGQPRFAVKAAAERMKREMDASKLEHRRVNESLQGIDSRNAAAHHVSDDACWLGRGGEF